jgi:hypothetical protein
VQISSQNWHHIQPEEIPVFHAFFELLTKNNNRPTPNG